MSNNIKFLRLVSSDGNIYYINPNDISHIIFRNPNNEIKILTSISLHNGDKINIDINEKDFKEKLSNLAEHSEAVGNRPNAQAHVNYI